MANQLPIIIICHNNYRYVQHTLDQLTTLKSDLLSQMWILDNLSDDPATVAYLREIVNGHKHQHHPQVIFNDRNEGPWIQPNCNVHIYKALPTRFVMTDADLAFHPEMPANFLDQLLEISMAHPEASKIGLALDISDPKKMFPGNYSNGLTISQWEQQFWQQRLPDDHYQLYRASVDTTFCLVNKKVPKNQASIRVAGEFTARHLPWYLENSIYTLEDRHQLSLGQLNKKFSTISRLIINYVQGKQEKQIVRSLTGQSTVPKKFIKTTIPSELG